jgi:Bacterial Ig-like domain (group 3)
VQFFDGKKKLGTAMLVNGATTLQLAFTSMGGHELMATCAGDANFTPSTSPIFTHSVSR